MLLHEPSSEPEAPYSPFTDNSAIRRVHREGVLLLGGGRALLMQLAHPAVAAGVAEHSYFRLDPRRRLLETLRLIFALVYGSPREVRAAAGAINAMHSRVVGETYRALDPELLSWVLATLIDTALVMHERFLRPLSAEEARAYYADMRRMGSLLGLPAEAAPADLEAFREYVSFMVATLEVTPIARSLARDVFPLSPPPVAPVSWSMWQLTAGLLPARLRGQFGMSWGPLRQAALAGLTVTSRSALPLVPGRLRGTPRIVLPRSRGGWRWP